MAYAAVISLKQTILPLVYSPHISLVPDASREIIQYAYFVTVFLQESLEELDSNSSSNVSRSRSRSRRSVNALDGRIREVVSSFEVLLESHISDQIKPDQSSQYSIDLQDLRRDVDSFAEMVKKMVEEYVYEFEKPLSEDEEEEEEEGGGEEEDDDANGFCRRNGKMIGLSDKFSQTKDVLTSDWGFPFTTLVGMAGIGKTTLAINIYRDELILRHFERRAWVKVGRKCRLNKIARSILAQLNHGRESRLMEGEGEIGQYLEEVFKTTRCLIVLDDVWDTEVKDYLNNLIPNDSKNVQILVTSRLHEVSEEKSTLVILQLLNKEESWELLYEKVFVEGGRPFNSRLEKAGKKIAEKCDGLPLMIVMVADALSKTEMSPEYWEKVAEKQNSVFKDAYDRISKVLLPSYEHLPHYLKPCFLSIGVFLENDKVSRSNIVNLWIAEGFVEPNKTQTLEDCANKCLEAIAANCLVITIYQRSTGRYGSIKSCRLHSCFWHMCSKVAAESKFYHVLNSLDDVLAKGIISQQSRLCIHNNILLGINGVNDSMEEHCRFSARSLLCFGPYHPYPVSICFSLRSLRVLDALKIRFYEFPDNVLNLVRLRYLALICNGEISKSISKLGSLLFLIICQHMCIKYVGVSSFVPLEIWDMQELKYIRIIGRDLPSPNYGPALENLLTLLGVSAHSCTKEVFERMPNLKKLGIEIKLEPNSDDVAPLSCLEHISRLNKLESLKCVVLNPELRFEVVAPLTFRSMFPSNLHKLHLGGLGCPWECMSAIGLLPNLRVLKLRSYAFWGPKWEIQNDIFKVLQVLVIEDTDLVQWKVEHGGFPMMVLLSIKDCYKLKEIHWEPDDCLERIEADDCSPSTVRWVNKIKSRREDPFFHSYVHSSWNETSVKP